MPDAQPAQPRLQPEDIRDAPGGLQRALARDGLLGRSCLAWWSPPDAAMARALRATADLLGRLEHPALAPLLLRFTDAPAGTVAGHDAPLVGYAVAWACGGDLLHDLATAETAERVRAIAALRDVITWLHQQDIVHGAIGADTVSWRDSALSLALPPHPRAANPTPDDLEADRQALQRLAASLGVDALPHGPLPMPTPIVPRRASVEHLLDAARAGDHRPVALIGEVGSHRARLARRLLALRADAGVPTLDLSRARTPLLTLHRLLFPPEATPTLDAAWLRTARERLAAAPWHGALFLGCLDQLPGPERGLLRALALPLAEAGFEVWFGDDAPTPDALALRMPRLRSVESEAFARANQVPYGAGVERLRVDAAGRPGALLRGLRPCSAAQATRILSMFPPGLPARIVSALPAPVRQALPALTRARCAHFDDAGDLHVDLTPTERVDITPSPPLEAALRDPLGELDPLWLGLTWARLGRTEQAAALFDRARARAGGRDALLDELARHLARAGHEPAARVAAELALARRAPHRALAALTGLPETDAVQILRAHALTDLGRPAEALAALGPPDDRGGAWWLARGRACLMAHDMEGAWEAANHARAAAGPSTRRGGLLLAVRVLLARPQLATTAIDPLLAALDGEIGVGTRIARAQLRLGLGDGAGAAADLETAIDRADRLGATLLATALRLPLARLHHHLGATDAAQRALRDAARRAAFAGACGLAGAALGHLIDLALTRGDLTAASAARDELTHLEQPPQGIAPSVTMALARIALAEGAPKTAARLLEALDPSSLDASTAWDHGALLCQSQLDHGAADVASALADALHPAPDAQRARWLLATQGRALLARGRALLDAALGTLPEGEAPAERAEAGALLLAWAGEDLSPAQIAERRAGLERAESLLTGAPKERAAALRARLTAPEPAVPAFTEAPTVPAEAREVLGVILPTADAARDLDTTLALLDPSQSNNLLLTGPTGAGKRVFAERVARERLGLDGLEEVVLRRMDPQMLVGLLVGTKRGEFTGALDQAGAIHRAIQGRRALLLDEVHTLDRVGQEILLPLLEVPQRRFGGLIRSSSVVEAPLQILLATNEDVSGSAWRQVFRTDLWFRMSQHHVHLPALTERGGGAVQRYLAGMLRDEGVEDPDHALEPRALHALAGQAWEGNLRELAAVARRVARLHRHLGRRLAVQDLRRVAVGSDGPNVEPLPTQDVLESLELNAVVEALQRCAWSQTAAAERLGVSKYRLHRILGKHGLLDWVREQRDARGGAAS